jgi:hypothetical protein
MNWCGTARVSKRLTDETYRLLTRAVLLESEAQAGRQDVCPVILRGEVALVIAVMALSIFSLRL